MYHDHHSIYELEDLLYRGNAEHIITLLYAKESSRLSSPAELEVLARACFLSGQIQQALDQYLLLINDKSLEEDRMLWYRARTNCAAVLLHLGNVQEAYKRLEEILYSNGVQQQHVSVRAVAAANLGMLHELHRGDLDEAERHYLSALYGQDTYFDAWLGLARVYYSMNELDESLRCSLQAMRCTPRLLSSSHSDDSAARNRLSYCLIIASAVKIEQGWRSEAEALLLYSRDICPYLSAVDCMLAHLYRRGNDVVSSLEHLLHALYKQPDDMHALNMLVSLYIETQQFDNARLVLDAFQRIGVRTGYSPHYYLLYKLQSLSLRCIIGTDYQSLHKELEYIITGTKKYLAGGASPLLSSAASSAYCLLSILPRPGSGPAAFSHASPVLYLVGHYGLTASIFSQNGLARGTSLAALDAYGLLLIWHMLHESGSSLSALLFIRALYERNKSYNGTGYTGEIGSMIPFWYSHALAEAGSPWRLLQYVQLLADKVIRSDADRQFLFLLKAFAYNRMSKTLLLEQQENVEALQECLRLVSPAGAEDAASFASARYERCLFLLRTKQLDAAEELMPDKKTFATWSQPLKLLYVRLLLKRNTMILARQALYRLDSLLQYNPDLEQASYLKLKALYMMGDQSRFEEHFRRFQPRAFEFKVRKAKLGVLQALSARVEDRAKERLEYLETVLHDFERWKSSNDIPDECMPMDYLWFSFRLASCEYLVLSEQQHRVEGVLERMSRELAHPILDLFVRDSQDYLDRYATSQSVLLPYPRVFISVKSFARLVYAKCASLSRLRGYKGVVAFCTPIVAPDEATQDIKIDKRLEKRLAEVLGDDAVLSSCWLSLADAIAEQGLAQYASSLIKLAGTYRFPRVGSIYPLAKISFLIDDIDSLETHVKAITKLGLQGTTADASRVYASLFLYMNLFDLSIMISRLYTISENYAALTAEKRTPDKSRELAQSFGRVVQTIRDLLPEHRSLPEPLAKHFEKRLLDFSEMVAQAPRSLALISAMEVHEMILQVRPYAEKSLRYLLQHFCKQKDLQRVGEVAYRYVGGVLSLAYDLNTEQRDLISSVTLVLGSGAGSSGTDQVFEYLQRKLPLRDRKEFTELHFATSKAKTSRRWQDISIDWLLQRAYVDRASLSLFHWKYLSSALLACQEGSLDYYQDLALLYYFVQHQDGVKSQSQETDLGNTPRLPANSFFHVLLRLPYVSRDYYFQALSELWNGFDGDYFHSQLYYTHLSRLLATEQRELVLPEDVRSLPYPLARSNSLSSAIQYALDSFTVASPQDEEIMVLATRHSYGELSTNDKDTKQSEYIAWTVLAFVLFGSSTIRQEEDALSKILVLCNCVAPFIMNEGADTASGVSALSAFFHEYSNRDDALGKRFNKVQLKTQGEFLSTSFYILVEKMIVAMARHGYNGVDWLKLAAVDIVMALLEHHKPVASDAELAQAQDVQQQVERILDSLRVGAAVEQKATTIMRHPDLSNNGLAQDWKTWYALLVISHKYSSYDGLLSQKLDDCFASSRAFARGMFRAASTAIQRFHPEEGTAAVESSPIELLRFLDSFFVCGVPLAFTSNRQDKGARPTIPSQSSHELGRCIVAALPIFMEALREELDCVETCFPKVPTSAIKELARDFCSLRTLLPFGLKEALCINVLFMETIARACSFVSFILASRQPVGFDERMREECAKALSLHCRAFASSEYFLVSIVANCRSKASLDLLLDSMVLTPSQDKRMSLVELFGLTASALPKTKDSSELARRLSLLLAPILLEAQYQEQKAQLVLHKSTDGKKRIEIRIGDRSWMELDGQEEFEGRVQTEWLQQLAHEALGDRYHKNRFIKLGNSLYFGLNRDSDDDLVCLGDISGSQATAEPQAAEVAAFFNSLAQRMDEDKNVSDNVLLRWKTQTKTRQKGSDAVVVTRQQHVVLSPSWHRRLTELIRRFARTLVSNKLINAVPMEFSDVFLDISGGKKLSGSDEILVFEQVKGLAVEGSTVVAPLDSSPLAFSQASPVLQRIMYLVPNGRSLFEKEIRDAMNSVVFDALATQRLHFAAQALEMRDSPVPVREVVTGSESKNIIVYTKSSIDMSQSNLDTAKARALYRMKTTLASAQVTDQDGIPFIELPAELLSPSSSLADEYLLKLMKRKTKLQEEIQAQAMEDIVSVMQQPAGRAVSASSEEAILQPIHDDQPEAATTTGETKIDEHVRTSYRRCRTAMQKPNNL